MPLCRKLKLVNVTNMPLCRKLKLINVTNMLQCRKMTMANMPQCWEMCLQLRVKRQGDSEIESASVGSWGSWLPRLGALMFIVVGDM